MQADKSNAGNRNGKADNKPQRQMFFLEKNLAEDCSEKRADTYDNTYVRSICIIDGDVFKKLIKDYSGKAGEGKENIVAPCNFFKAGTENPKAKISRDKSVKKNGSRNKIFRLKEDFRFV